MRYPKDFKQVTNKHIQAWLNVQARAYGDSYKLGTQSNTPIDMFLKEIYGINATFLAGSEISYDNHTYSSELINSGYYLFNNNGLLHTTIKAWKIILNYDNKDAKLFS